MFLHMKKIITLSIYYLKQNIKLRTAWIYYICRFRWKLRASLFSSMQQSASLHLPSECAYPKVEKMYHLAHRYGNSFKVATRRYDGINIRLRCCSSKKSLSLSRCTFLPLILTLSCQRIKWNERGKEKEKKDTTTLI